MSAASLIPLAVGVAPPELARPSQLLFHKQGIQAKTVTSPPRVSVVLSTPGKSMRPREGNVELGGGLSQAGQEALLEQFRGHLGRSGGGGRGESFLETWNNHQGVERPAAAVSEKVQQKALLLHSDAHIHLSWDPNSETMTQNAPRPKVRFWKLTNRESECQKTLREKDVTEMQESIKTIWETAAPSFFTNPQGSSRKAEHRATRQS